ncbi:MAG: hypothetical protein JNK15_17185, partial [Planctomycetes bacterium]|nr:hypothetical protein [Planctomycetota bacterium]
MKAMHLVLVGAALVAGLRAQAFDAADSARRCVDLAALQDRGALTVELAVAALADADDNVARTAAAIVRHEWAELPLAWFHAVDREPAAARTMLREFAAGPRLAAAVWVEDRTRAVVGRTLDDRLLAMAARGRPLAFAEATLLLDVLASGEAGDGFRAAVDGLGERTADALVGRLHAALQQGVLPMERAWPLLDRLSAKGTLALLGVVASLPAKPAEALLAYVHQRAPEVVRERAASALDGAERLQPWLAYVAPVLDRPARLQRVVALATRAPESAAVREAAVRALLDAPALDGATLHQLDLVGSESLRALAVAIDRIPVDLLRQWFDGGVDLRKAVVRALARRQRLEPELESFLVDEIEAAGTIDGEHCSAVAHALAQRGGAAALARIMPWVRASEHGGEVIAALGRRQDAFVVDLLHAELAVADRGPAAAVRSAHRDDVVLALVAHGDESMLERLVVATTAASTPPAFVRRCANHARPLPARFALRLLGVVGARGEPTAHLAPEVRAELLAWAASAVADEAVRDALVGFWRRPIDDPDGELQDVVAHALAGSPFRATMVAELRAAIAVGPLPEDLHGLPFDLLGTMPQPLSLADLELCADLVLRLPRTDPERERSAVRRWPDGISGFPLVAAVAEQLRLATAEAAGATFAAAVAHALADPAHTNISRSRLSVLWRELWCAPAVQQAVAAPTAKLWLALPEHAGSAAAAGAAHL